MGNTDVKSDEIATTAHKHNALTVIHHTANIPPEWVTHTVWYHCAPHEVSSAADIPALIARVRQLGGDIITLPASCEITDIAALNDLAEKRFIRLIPQLDDAANTEELLTSWLAHSGWGVELGMHHAGEPLLAKSGITLGDIQARVSLAHPHTVMSLGLWAQNTKEYATLADEVRDLYIHIVRTRPWDLPLTASNLGPQLIELYRLFDSAGTLPAWDLSGDAATHAAGALSPTGALLIALALPGLTHIDGETTELIPQLRHYLRIRESYNLARSSMAIDTRDADAGRISLFINHVEVRINLSAQDEELEPGTTVLATSSDSLRYQKTGDLQVLPAGEVAWLKS